MEKLLKKCLFAVMAIFIVTSFVSCSNDDEPDFNSTDDIAGLYVGQINAIGLPKDEAEIAYVTLEKKSSSTVSCKIESEGWGIDSEKVNLSCTFLGSVVSLESETSKNIIGQAFSGNLQLTFGMGEFTFQFTGKKD